MNWIQRKIYLYNVTFGLFMLDWWERYLFSILYGVLSVGSNKIVKYVKKRKHISMLYDVAFVHSLMLADVLVVVLMWFIFYNGSRYVTDFFQRHLILSSETSA